MSLIELIMVFFGVGLLTIGGGLVSIPLLLNVFVEGGVLTSTFFYQLVSIAESTPGPIAINLATYLGLIQANVFGALLATTSFILPSYLLVEFIYPFYIRFRHLHGIHVTMRVLTLTVLSLIGITLVRMVEHLFEVTFTEGIIPWVGFSLLAIIYFYNQKRPLLLIGCGALFGLFFLG
jgi:chromate transporter